MSQMTHLLKLMSSINGAIPSAVKIIITFNIYRQLAALLMGSSATKLLVLFSCTLSIIIASLTICVQVVPVTSSYLYHCDHLILTCNVPVGEKSLATSVLPVLPYLQRHSVIFRVPIDKRPNLLKHIPYIKNEN